MTVRNFVSFSVDVTDELGERWQGTFEECVAVMSHNQEMAVGRARRNLLGPVNSDTPADQQDFYFAHAVAEINIRNAKSECVPQWWSKAGGGDRSPRVVEAVYEAQNKAIKAFLDEKLGKPAEKAGAEVRKHRGEQREQEKQ